jgi:CheY-like chemotaxis protein
MRNDVGEPRVVRLLVVEDNEAYAYLIKKAFSYRKDLTRWELTLAEDGEQAVRILFAEEQAHAPLPEIILLDWKLPKISGNEVLQRLKEHPELRRIPVLVFSTSSGSGQKPLTFRKWSGRGYRKPGIFDRYSSPVRRTRSRNRGSARMGSKYGCTLRNCRIFDCSL